MRNINRLSVLHTQSILPAQAYIALCLLQSKSFDRSKDNCIVGFYISVRLSIATISVVSFLAN